MDEKKVRIGSAGNTELPALLALRAKGYRVWLHYYRENGSADPHPGHDVLYQAECEGASFCANTGLELLGLAAMWEVRGNDWELKAGEAAFDDELHATAKTFDQEGNEIEDECS